MFKGFSIKEWERGALFMVYSSLFLALLNFSIKGSIAFLGVLETTFLRAFIPFCFLLGILAWRKTWHELEPQISMSLHVLRSLSAVLVQLFLNYYLTRGTLANATMLWATGPIYIPILTQIFFRQKTPAVTWISIGICLVGVAMMIKPTHGIFDPFSIWGICAGILTAFSQILWGHNVEKGTITENIFYLGLFSSILSFFIWIVFGSPGEAKTPDTFLLWLSMIGIGLASLGNQLFRSKAYQKAPPYLLTPLLYVSVVGAAFFDIVFYHNWPEAWQYGGFALVSAGTLLKWWYLKKMSDQLG